jgi:hypothetical protein
VMMLVAIQVLACWPSVGTTGGKTQRGQFRGTGAGAAIDATAWVCSNLSITA